MKALAAFTLAAATLCLSAPASAQFAKAEDAIKYRQSALFVMGQHFSRLGAMANGRIPFDAKAAQENAMATKASTPLGGLARAIYAAHSIAGHGGEDFSSVIKMLQKKG